MTASSLTQSKELLRHYRITFCKTFTQFEAYYIMSCNKSLYDANWQDSLRQVKTCFRMEKKNGKRNEKEKLKEKDRIEKNRKKWK